MPRELTGEALKCQAPIAKGRFAFVRDFAKWLLIAWCVNLLTLPLLMIADMVNLEALLSIYYLVLFGVFFPPVCFANPVVAVFLLGCVVNRGRSRRRPMVIAQAVISGNPAACSHTHAKEFL